MQYVIQCLRRRALWQAFAVLLTGAPAWACYSGLGMIPTADTVGFGKHVFEVQFDGTLASGKTHVCLLNTQFGLHPRVEAGVDFDLSAQSEPSHLLNAKYVLPGGDGSGPAFALGVCNAGNHVRGSPYLVATRDLGALRFHLGRMRIEGTGRWFAGMDRTISSRWVLMADWMGGEDQFASVGGSCRLSPHFGVMAALAFPNVKSGQVGFTLHLVLD